MLFGFLEMWMNAKVTDFVGGLAIFDLHAAPNSCNT